MFGLTTKFDITIGNPPYVRQEEIKEQKPALEKHYKGTKDAPGCYSGTADLYVYFIQRSIELLNGRGFCLHHLKISGIAPNMEPTCGAGSTAG